MKVADIMQSRLVTIPADAPVSEAVTVLADAHVSAVPVVDERRKVVGVLSTTDVLQAEAECESAEERERLFTDVKVRELMTPRPLVIAPEASVNEAAQHMLYLDVHRLFVEQGGELVGVISQSDVVRVVATMRPRVGA